MIVGFIGFGNVASTLTKTLLSNGIEVLTSFEGRSEKTKELANNSGVTIIDSYLRVAKLSDILISTVTPNEAFDVAIKYGNLAKDIFIDLNNISPKKTLEIATFLYKSHTEDIGDYSNNFSYIKKDYSNFIKGAIIGKIEDENSVIYVSGKNAEKAIILNSYGLNFKIIGKNVEDTASIKMLRSIYTKGVTAVICEVLQAADCMGLTSELFESLAITEGENFENKAKSRANSLINSQNRKYHEISEILDFLDSIYIMDDFEFNSIMSKATKSKFKYDLCLDD